MPEKRVDIWTVVLGLGVLGTWALLTYHGFRDHSVIADALVATEFGRAIPNDLPSGLWDGRLGRGPEHVTMWVAAFTSSVTGNAADEIKLAHVFHAFFYSATAIPAYFLARFAGTKKPLAVLAGLLAIAGPAAVFGTTLINTSAGYLSATILVLAMCLLLNEPSRKTELFFLGAIVLTAVSRVGFAPLAVALIPALVVVSLRDRPEGTTYWNWARGFPLATARSYPVLTGAAALMLAFLVVKGRSAVLGYGDGRFNQFDALNASTVWLQAKQTLARMTMTCGPVFLIAAIAAALTQAAKPRTRRDGIFAVTAISFVAVLLYIPYLDFSHDRYVMPAVALVAVGACRFLELGKRSVLIPVVGAALAFAFIEFPAGLALGDNAITLPGATFYTTVAEYRLSAISSGDDFLIFIAVAVVAGALMLWATIGRTTKAPRIGLAVLVAFSVCVQLAGMLWTTQRWDRADSDTTTAFDYLSILEGNVPAADVVYILRTDEPNTLLEAEAPRLRFFNRMPVESVTLPSGPREVVCCNLPALGVDRETGALATTTDKRVGFLITPGYHIGLPAAQRTVHVGVFDVIEPSAPARLDYLFLNPSPAGWTRPGIPMHIRAYSATRAKRCLRATVVSPAAAVRWRLGERSGILRAGKFAEVAAPIDLATREISFRSAPLHSRKATGARLDKISVGGCS